MKVIPLTKGYEALVDDGMYESLSEFKWHVLDSHPIHRYAARWSRGFIPRKSIRMHHAVLGVSGEELTEKFVVVDHIDRNGLNSQRDNLRIASRRENAINSDRSDNALGIYFDSHRLMYKAIDLTEGRKFIGWYHTFEEALKGKAAYENN